MSVTVVATTNESSFAVAYADASALILDAVAAVGAERHQLFHRAKARALAAILHTDSDIEQALAQQLTAYIGVAQQRGWDRL